MNGAELYSERDAVDMKRGFLILLPNQQYLLWLAFEENRVTEILLRLARHFTGAKKRC